MSTRPSADLLLLVSAAAGYGGIQAANRLLLSAATKSGRDVRVVTLEDPSAPGRAAGAFTPKMRFLWKAISLQARTRGRIILVTHVGLTPIGRIMKRLVRGRLLVLLHGVEVWRPLPRRSLWGLAGADEVVAVSAFTLSCFLAVNPTAANIPSVVCHLAARQLPRPAAVDWEPSAGRALIVGRLWGRGLEKGQDRLVRLWARVVERYPAWELVIVGDGDGRVDLERLARDVGVEKVVRFVGAIDDAELAALYANSDLFVLPSRGEGFGLVLAEAMAQGLPCIASREDAGSEVVEDGVTGILVVPDDEDELYAAVCRLMGDPALRRRLGEAGKARAATEFSVTAFDQRIEAILRRHD